MERSVNEYVTVDLVEDRKREKPIVYDKPMKWLAAQAILDYPRFGFIDRSINSACKFIGKHRCTSRLSLSGREKKTITQINDIATQFDELGVYAICIIGGESLIITDLDEMIEAIDPECYFIFMTTNGWMETRDRERRVHPDRCLVGEDRIFINQHMHKVVEAETLPLSYEEGVGCHL